MAEPITGFAVIRSPDSCLRGMIMFDFCVPVELFASGIGAGVKFDGASFDGFSWNVRWGGEFEGAAAGGELL